MAVVPLYVRLVTLPQSVVAAGIDLGALAGTGRASGIHAGQFVRLGIAVQVLLLIARAVQRPLPQLAEVGVDKGVAVAGSAQAVGKGRCAAGAVARSRLGAGVACPHQAVLFVVAEVLALTAA